MIMSKSQTCRETHRFWTSPRSWIQISKLRMESVNQVSNRNNKRTYFKLENNQATKYLIKTCWKNKVEFKGHWWLQEQILQDLVGQMFEMIPSLKWLRTTGSLSKAVQCIPWPILHSNGLQEPLGEWWMFNKNHSPVKPFALQDRQLEAQKVTKSKQCPSTSLYHTWGLPLASKNQAARYKSLYCPYPMLQRRWKRHLCLQHSFLRQKFFSETRRSFIYNNS